MDSNPYESSKTRAFPVDEGQLKVRARQLLLRRDSDSGMWFYARYTWPRHLIASSIYIACFAYFWYLGHQYFAIVLGAFFFGLKARDLAWWRALAREWPITANFIDWQKVEDLASD